MCGICGFTGDADPGVLRRMNQALVHRGPDDEGMLSAGHVHLAMRRLSIVDLDGGHQPIANEDHTIHTVFNGEIYNHVALREALIAEGHRFRSDHSDTEVIVHLYEEHGEDWPIHVNGMFGVALWDARSDTLLLYRDRVGKKPLYYAVVNGDVVFGSEIKAVLAHGGVSRDLDYASLYHYLGLKNTSAPATAYAAVKQVLPGSVLVWQGGRVRTRAYWRPDFSSPLADITEAEAAGRILELLDDAVRIRMQCDVPFGAYLSGGLDSSSVVALMKRHHRGALKTFCLGYPDQAEGQFAGKADDVAFARTMARRLDTDHHECVLSAERFAEVMPEVLRAFDEPFSGTVSTFVLTELLHRHVKVALSGDGADELFGSYLAHRMSFPIENYVRLADQGKGEWDALDGGERAMLHPFDNPAQFAFLKRVASNDIAQWRARLAVFTPAQRRDLLAPDVLEQAHGADQADPIRQLAPGLTATDALNRSLELDQNELLPNQVLPFVDRLSMAHSVEIRCPYLDYRLVEFAARLPGRLKIRNGVVKHIQKRALAGLLPPELVARPKEGFVQPVYSWMHGCLRGWTESWLDRLPRDLFRREAVAEWTRVFRSGEPSVNAKIWNLVCFSIWQETLGRG